MRHWSNQTVLNQLEHETHNLLEQAGECHGGLGQVLKGFETGNDDKRLDNVVLLNQRY